MGMVGTKKGDTLVVSPADIDLYKGVVLHGN